jgi:hypothetical protein
MPKLLFNKTSEERKEDRNKRKTIRKFVREEKKSALQDVHSSKKSSTRKSDLEAGYQTSHRTSQDDKLEKSDRRKDVWKPKKSIRKDAKATKAELMAGLKDREGNTAVPTDGTPVRKIRKAQRLRGKAEDEAAKRGADSNPSKEKNPIGGRLKTLFTRNGEKREKPYKEKKKWFGKNKVNCIKGEGC